MSLKNNKGFSLVEIITSIAILGVVIVGIMNLGKIQNQSVTGAKGTIDLAKALVSINAVLQEPRSCSQNLETKSVNIEENILQLETKTGTVLFEAGEPILSGTYRIKRMYIGQYNVNSGRAEFKVEFELAKKANAIQAITRTIYFYPNVIVATGKIVDCNKGIEDIAAGLLEKMCFEIDGDIICDYSNVMARAKKSFCDAHNWLSWGSGKCNVVDSGKSCDAGIYFQGYDVNGNLTCFTPPAPPSYVNSNGTCGALENSCLSGTLEDLPDALPTRLWTCRGTGTGTNAACRFAGVPPTPVAGTCDASNNICSSGILNNIADSATEYLWSCLGTFGGGDVSCSEVKPILPFGRCNNTINNSCEIGTLNNISDSVTNYLWNCEAAGGDASCSKAKVVASLCRSLDGSPNGNCTWQAIGAGIGNEMGQGQTGGEGPNICPYPEGSACGDQSAVMGCTQTQMLCIP